MNGLGKLSDLAIFVARHEAAFLLVIAVAWSLGRQLTRRVGYRSELEAAVLSVTCGLGALATGLFFLAIAGLFDLPWVLAFLAAVLLISRSSWWAIPDLMRRGRQSRHSTGVVVVMSLLGLALGPLALLPLYPPTEFDATMFHLPFAESIVNGHRLDFFSELRYPVFPALQHTLYALGLALDGDVAPALLHTACFALVGMLLFVWARELSSTRAGLWAALIWLGTPVAIWSGTAAYVDCGLALFVLAALFCLARYVRSRESAWLFLGGAFAAFAADTKYHGLFFVSVFLLAAFVVTLRARQLKRALLVGGLVAVLMLPWYGYITYFTYNPVFPFAPQVFGWSPWSPELMWEEEDGPPPDLEGERGVGAVAGKLTGNIQRADSLRVLLLPINLFLHPERFKGRPPSPIYALTGFLILGLAFRYRHARFLGGVVAVYGFLWAHTALDTRYLLPVLPLAALLGGEGLDRLLRWRPGPMPKWPGAWVGVLLTAVLFASLFLTTARIVLSAGVPPTSPQKRLDFVEKREPILGAIRAHNHRSREGSRVYGLFCENLRHFSKRNLVGEWNGRNRYVRVFRHLWDPAELYRRLRAMRVGYLILPDTRSHRGGRLADISIPPPRRLASRFEKVWGDENATLYRLLRPNEIAERESSSEASDEGATDSKDGEPPPS